MDQKKFRHAEDATSQRIKELLLDRSLTQEDLAALADTNNC